MIKQTDKLKDQRLAGQRMSRRQWVVAVVVSLLPLLPAIALCGDKQQWIPGWLTTTHMNVARAGAAVVKEGRTLYIIGGVDGHDFLRSVEYAHINDDGSLDPWLFTSALNEARGFFAAVASDGYLYVVGGGNGPSGEHLLRSAERAPIKADGSLGNWQTLTTNLNLPRRCVKLLLQDRRLFALGGFGGSLLDSVESAPILDDGTLGPWHIEDRHMTMPRYVNTAKHIGDIAIVIGGHREDGGVGLKAVETARLDNNGIASDWHDDAPLNSGRYALAAATDGHTLWAIGGLDGAIYSDHIEKTSVDTSATSRYLAAWQDTTPLSSPRANFGAIVDNGFIYIIGGTNRDGYYNSVELAQINDAGDIGFYGTAAKAEAYNKRKATTKEPSLPNSGRVIAVVQTDAYTYLKVMGAGGSSWIAAPHGEFKKGDNIHYSRGMTMVQFYSRSLGRTFDEILFVERVEKD